MNTEFAILGMGRLGRALAVALRGQGATVACWNRASGGAGRAIVNGGEPAGMDAPTAAKLARTVVLTVPDDALEPLGASLSAADWTGRTVIHCSGRMGTEPLAPLAIRGAAAVAAHPVMAFAGDIAADGARMAGIGWGVTAGDADALRLGFAFAERLGGRPFAVSEDKRALYHAALTHAINHLVTLTVQGTALLGQAGAEEPAAVLGPAMAAALANALARGPAAATGPVVRGDAGTVAAHHRALAGSAPEVLPAYAEMTRAGIALALEAGRIGNAQADRLREALSTP